MSTYETNSENRVTVEQAKAWKRGQSTTLRARCNVGERNPNSANLHAKRTVNPYWLAVAWSEKRQCFYYYLKNGNPVEDFGYLTIDPVE